MAHLKSLKPLKEKTDLYKYWIQYIYDVLNTCRHHDDVLGNVTNGLLKNNYQTFSEIRNELLEELNAGNTEQEEFNNLKALSVIEEIFINLNKYNDEFTPKKLDEIFKALKIEWDKNDFDKLKQISMIVSQDWDKFVNPWIEILCRTIKIHSNEAKKLKILSNYRLDAIIYHLKANSGETLMDSKNSDSLLSNEKPLKEKPRRKIESSFSIDFESHLKYIKDKDNRVLQEIEADLKKMMQGLIGGNYVDESTKFNQFRQIFSGKEISEKVVWKGNINHLHYFLAKLYKEKLMPVNGNYLWKVGSFCFDIRKEESKFSKAITGANESPSEDQQKKLNTCIDYLQIKKV